LLEGIEIVCLRPSAHLNNCGGRVIDVAWVWRIYARLFTHIDVTASRGGLGRRRIRRRTKPEDFYQTRDAALMRSSSQVPIREAELRFLHNEDMSDEPTSLGDDGDYGSTKFLPLGESGYPSDGSTPCSTDSPHTPSHAPSSQSTPNDPVLRVRSESFLRI
jgi:hypothetical protein